MAKLGALFGVAVVLIAANSQLLGEHLRFWVSIGALAIGAVASLVGVRQVIVIPRLEREALEAQASATLRSQLQAVHRPEE